MTPYTLPNAVVPEPDESLAGLLMRNAERYRFRNPVRLLHRLNLNVQFIPVVCQADPAEELGLKVRALLGLSYGEGALLTLARMVLRAGQNYQLRLADASVPKLDPAAPLSLIWPSWYPETSEDRQRDAATLTGLVAANQLSRETALKRLAPTYDIEDIPAELARIANSPPPPLAGGGRGEGSRP